MATVRYFAAAAEAAGTEQEQVSADTIEELLTRLTSQHGDILAEVLRRSSLLHHGQHVGDLNTPLTTDSVVDVLPPFAGG